MKVFITGGTGFIGSAIIPLLVEQGYQVTGLCRDEKKADQLKKQGATPVIGDLTSLDVLAQNAKESDGVIHLAFRLDWANFASSCIEEKNAIQTMCEAMAGTGKPFIGTGGLLVCAQPAGSIPADETFDKFEVPPQLALRLENEKVLLKYKEKGVKAMVIRLSPTVHDTIKQGLVTMWMYGCKTVGYVPYIDGGENKWPSVHRLDAATLYTRAFEKGGAGSVYHALSEILTMKEMAGAMGKKLELEVKDLSLSEVPPQLVPLSYVFSMNAECTADITRSELGWVPKQIGLLQDITNCSV